MGFYTLGLEENMSHAIECTPPRRGSYNPALRSAALGER
jgi:hypothetical protein